MPTPNPDLQTLMNKLVRIEREVARPQSDEQMNALLDERLETTERLAAARATSIDDLVLKLEVLCDRLHEDLAPHDRGGHLTACLAKAIWSEARGLSRSDD